MVLTDMKNNPTLLGGSRGIVVGGRAAPSSSWPPSPQQQQQEQPRILVYLTTTCSSCQLRHLQRCWPRSMQAAPLLRKSHVLLYAGCGGSGNGGFGGGADDGSTANSGESTREAAWIEALLRLPNANVSLAWRALNPGLQRVVTGAALLAARRGWFAGYDWVVRANPDVVFEVLNSQSSTESASKARRKERASLLFG